jgi:citrate lyase subunit beta / citryl-CoA lyase
MPTVARTFLFVPGDRPERFDKACASGADAVVIDLEDAVAPDAKQRARDAIAAWLGRGDQPPPWLRINAAGSAWFNDDLALARHPAIAGAMLPKAESAADVRAVGVASVIALIESARGMARLDAIASAPGMTRLAFGSIDFQADVGIPGEGDALLAFRSALVLASRLADLAPPIDGVTPAIDDADLLRSETLRARELGFGGKLCIHPKQVNVVREAFAPTAAERAWAQRVIEAVERGGEGALAVDGRMVDRPVILRARTILEG